MHGDQKRLTQTHGNRESGIPAFTPGEFMGTVPVRRAHTIACERQKGEQTCLLYLQTPRHLRSAQVVPVYLPGDAPLCTAATARFASGPVSWQMGKEPWPPQRFFDRYLYAKNARRLRYKKILALAQKQSAMIRVPTRRMKSATSPLSCFLPKGEYSGESVPGIPGESVPPIPWQSVPLFSGQICC